MLSSSKTSVPKHARSGRTPVSKDIQRAMRRLRSEHFEKYLDHVKLVNEQDHDRARRFAKIFLGIPGFEFFMAIVILLNMIVMMVEIDQKTKDEGAISVLHWTEVFGWVVLIIFVVELVARLLAFQCMFWKDAWNVADFIIVLTDSLFSLVGLVAGSLFPVSILRIFRLAKLARVSKVLRLFPELRLLLAGLASSFQTIFWGTLLLAFVCLVWAMVGALFLHPLMEDVDYGDCERCPRAYSSVMQAMLTLWQTIVTGDSWGATAIPLLEKYPSTAVIFIPAFLSIGLAVINLILGVVVSVAQQAKTDLEEEEHADKILTKLEKQTHLIELCKRMDSDHKGSLNHDDILNAMDEPGEFHDMVQELEITKEDFDIVWTLLDTDGLGMVSYKQLVHTLCTIRSSSQEFMLTYIKYYITIIRNGLLIQMKEHHEEAMKLQNKLDEHFQKIEWGEDKLLARQECLLDSQRLQQVGSDDNQFIAGLCNSAANLNNSSCRDKYKDPDVVLEVAHDNVQKDFRVQNHSSSCWIHRVTSGIVDNEAHKLLRKVSHEIEYLRIEIKELLSGVSCRSEPSLPLANQGVTHNMLQPEMLTLPGTSVQKVRSEVHGTRGATHLLSI